MPLKLIRTDDPRLLGAPVMRELGATSAVAEATLLVPSVDQALACRRALADDPRAPHLLQVATPVAWAEERWGLWGDGRRVVDATARLALLRVLLNRARSQGALEGLAGTSGTLDLLARLCSEHLPELPPDQGDPRWRALGSAERKLCGLVCEYGEALRRRGLVELCEAMWLLPDALAEAHDSHPRVVAAGFDQAPPSVLRLLARLAGAGELVLVVRSDGGPATALAESSARAVVALCRELGVEVAEEESVEGHRAPAAGELLGLRARLFRMGEPSMGALEPSGRVALLEASGPLSEGELMCAELLERGRALAADAGTASLAVVVPDVGRAWSELAPKLATRGACVRASIPVRLDRIPQVRAFLGFARELARLSELDLGWPGPVQGPDGRPLPQLGDMSWWPPRPIVDFLLSDASGMGRQQAWELDRRWRGNRSLTPRQLLESLGRKRSTSPEVQQATAAILRGQIGHAAGLLAHAMEEADQAQADLARSRGEGPGTPGESRLRGIDGLRSLQAVSGSVSELGLGRGKSKGLAPAGMSLSELCDLFVELAGRQALRRRLVLGDEAAQVGVRLLSRPEAARLEPASHDLVLVSGLTAAEYPLAPRDDAYEALLSKLGLGGSDDPLELARSQFASAVAAARSSLLLERATHAADASVGYPAVMLTEALACYGFEGEGPCPLRVRGMGEGEASLCLSGEGSRPAPQGSRAVAAGSMLSPGLRGMIVVPRPGEAELPGGRPSLSASQMESYLECPHKWFTLRRLGLDRVDAGFGPLQMGSFAHRVLEVSHRRLATEAARAAGLLGDGGEADFELLGQSYVPGTRVTPQNLEHMRELVLTEVDHHLAHQLRRATTVAAQSLVPHDSGERLQLDFLRRDLLSTVEFELGVLEGFEPRHFELRFGGRRPQSVHVSYAGADFVGSVDRVDVNEHGCAVVIDYKHKGAAGFAAEYDVFGREGCPGPGGLRLPRRVQALIYAQVIRRMMPDLKVVGAMYLSTRGSRADQHELAGVVDANFADQVLGPARQARLDSCCCGGPGQLGFEELLDATEEQVAAAIGRMLAGDVRADPVDAKACQWCPVTNCERRLS
ncbi:PD-(D/E)XK nuclease family protein [Olsenella sp. DNF00959]|uniref:PD-(D/E)XK nuclease family protein n=1 Tax=Olsenella sp. DNF00959 TaxID=1476999 RepID=UPI000781731D|nr:PD-(D/E)XK nuclease family protein [Olsenella sp. DNF00959]KXB62405.1 hypothetical protein HMPREF1868_01492 [Olsenella sp. DNF00959]